ncbi:MAG: FAD-dependent thymidylate synthase [Candidatus Gracilibacteria bacterium]|nr:FAD-dependent thymidylate synthase [Candidatus Gracilibacteria bacterium]
MTQFTPEERTLLEKYVTSVDDNVFAIKGLPGIVGSVFARYSRAKGSFRKTLVKEFLKEGVIDPEHAQQLIERILIAYGDDSVGELEGANVSFEDISNLATKVIQDRRIGGSPIEQSSRYVVYNQKDEQGRWRYLRPKEIMDSAHAETYEKGMDRVFDIYDGLVEPLTKFYESKKPLEEAEYDVKGSGEKQKFADLSEEKDQKAFKRTYKFDLKTKTCDTIRCLLPTSTLTNVGMFGNGRYYQELLSHLYTQELDEMHDIAKKAHSNLNQIVAPFVKRAKRNEWLAEKRNAMRSLAKELFSEEVETCQQIDVQLQDPKKSANSQDPLLLETLTQALYPYTELSLETLSKRVADLDEANQKRILDAYSGDRKHRRCRPDRALEAGYPLTFDMVCDFGSYRDLQRHRMLTQQRQLITPNLGFSMPQDLIDAGVLPLIEEAQQICEDLYTKIRKDCGAQAAQYVVLFGYNIRWTMGMNIRAAQHMIELRTTPQGHPNYRKVAQLMAKAILERHSWAEQLLTFTDYDDYTWARADSEARQRVKENALEDKLQAETQHA